MASSSGQLQLIGTFKTAAAGVSTYTLAESSTDPMVINVSALQAAGFRGVELEFLGNTASSAYSANAILVGSKIGGSSKIQVKVLGTVGLTTASSAATDLTTALGLTGSWYPMDTVSTSWSSSSYGLNIVEGISAISNNAVAPSGSDMLNTVVSIPFLNGHTHIAISPTDTSTTKQMAVLLRGINMSL